MYNAIPAIFVKAAISYGDRIVNRFRVLTTSDADSDGNFVKMTTFPFNSLRPNDAHVRQ